MFPNMKSIKEFQSQPLVRNVIKSQSDSAQKNKSISDFLNKTNRQQYQNYKKSHQQQAEIPLQRLFFKNRDSSTRQTPSSLFLTKHLDEQLNTKPSMSFINNEQKYKESIDFHSRKMRHDNYLIDHKLAKSFKSFKLSANVCQRQTMTAPQGFRKTRPSLYQDPYVNETQGTRKIIVVNQLYMNMNRLQSLVMYVPDHNTEDPQKFTEFAEAVKNRLKINCRNLYFYLKDGTPVYNQFDIPLSHNLLIYSTSTVYKQVYHPALQLLESRCPTEEVEKVKVKRTANYSQQIDCIVDILVHQPYQPAGKKDIEEQLPDEIEVGDKNLSSKELKSALKHIKRDGNYKPLMQKMQKSNSIIPKVQSNQFNSYMNQELIIHNPKIEQLDTIERWYDQELRKIDFNAELQGDINQIHDKQVVNDNEIQMQVETVAELLTPLMDKFLGRKTVEQVEEDEGPEIKFEQTEEDENEKKEIVIKYHPIENVKKLINVRSSIEKLHRVNRELFIENIPKLLKKTNFTRYELHNSYLLYCALQQITSQRYECYNCDDGLDYKTYRNGIYQIFMQSEELAQEIFNKIDFNYSGFLNWQEFLELMVKIRAKTQKEKIDLFIKISDTDGNGFLSDKEIFKLSKICLSKFITNSDDFLDMLCEYYTRLIFDTCEIDINEEIPMQKLKDVIIGGSEESDLLCMFCGADI